MDLKNLSSNWNNLQKTLAKEKKSNKHEGGSNALKRKGSDNGHNFTNGVFKKRRTGLLRTATGKRPAKMGLSQSSETSKNDPANNPAALATPKSSLSASRSSLHDDDPIAVLLKPLSEPFTPNLGYYPAASSQKHKFVALDCEMVGVGPPPHSDSQLARVSITNYLGDILYDSYVQPVLPVTDYRTHVSGVTEAHLEPGSARSFKEVQDDVKGLLSGRILVGHAIKNDLEALIINHPKRDIRDTSQYPPYREISGGRTPALKRLASQFLGIKIQEGEHSSVVDARATMALFKREKDGFEKDNVRRFGVAKQAAPEEVDEEREELRKEKQRIKNKKKKKKRK